MSENLAAMKCVACEGGIPPLSHERVSKYLAQLKSGWAAERNVKIRKEFTFPDFKSALAFANRIGEIAEQEGHHPDLMVGWGKLAVELTTHAIKGLSENDFILAAKIDRIEE